jgi:hypothetical protein
MIRRKSKVTIMASVLIFIATSVVLSYAVLAMETKMIRIYGRFATAHVEPEAGTTYLIPDNLMVQKGTQVVWSNWSTTEIRIKFLRGKECKEATEGTTAFELDEEGCFITARYIPPKGTVSATFSKAGRYDYELEYVGKRAKDMGSIIVVE